MQNTYLILFLVFCSLPVSAQHDFAPIGAQWIQNAFIDEFSGVHLEDYYVFESEKDTLIDELNYRKVGDYLFHQDGDLVYYLWQDTLRLIYDYGVSVGDTVVYEMLRGGHTSTIFNTLLVDQVEYVSIGEDSLKRISCSLIDGELSTLPHVYLERMGCVRKIVEDYTDYFLVTIALEEWLRCYKDSTIEYQTATFQAVAQNGEDCLFRDITPVQEIENEHAFHIFPNPVGSQVLQIQSDYTQEVFVELYDLLGRPILQQAGRQPFEVPIESLPAGIYSLIIRNENRSIIYAQQIVKNND